MKSYPKVLHVDTSFAPPQNDKTSVWESVLDYRTYANIPQSWRNFEKLLRLDIALALRAKAVANQYDIILAGSERVGIPLALMGAGKPVVTVVHHMASRGKRELARLMGVARKWARIGYLSEADRDFMISYYNVPMSRMFRYISAPITQFTPGDLVCDGPIMSVGVSNRDYHTLIAALEHLLGYQTEIYAASRYKDLYRGNIQNALPEWVHFEQEVSPEELARRYRRARFVVMPLANTSQFSAGVSAVLEASAAGKAVIATKTQGMPDYVIDGVTGLLVPPHDSAALGDAIRKLWNDPHLAHQMGLAGRRHVEARFHPTTVTQETRESLMQVYAEHHPSR